MAKFKITINGIFVKEIHLAKTGTVDIEKVRKFLVKTQNYNPNIKVVPIKKKISNPLFAKNLEPENEKFSIHREINKIFS